MNDTLASIRGFEEEEIRALDAFRAQGGRAAALFCRFFPASLLEALGLWPLRILTGATVEAESAGERLVRPDACPYCKSLLGNFLDKNSLHGRADLVVGLITCDQMRHTLERLSADLALPVFPLQLPATDTPRAEAYFLSSVRRTLENLTAHLDASWNHAAVIKGDEARANAGGCLAELMRAGRTHPVVLHRLARLWAYARPGPFAAFLEKLTPVLPTFEARQKIILVGSVSCEEDDPLLEVLARHGVTPLPLTCTGLNALEGIVPLSAPEPDAIVEEAALRSFRSPACIRTRPNRRVYERILSTLEESGATGVILKTLSFCDLWYTEKERMRKNLPVPLLVLDTGYGEGSRDRALVRIEAFLETLPS